MWRKRLHLSVWGRSLLTNVSFAAGRVQSAPKLQGVDVPRVTNHSEVKELMNHNPSYISPFASTTQLSWSQFPHQRWNLGPQQWNYRVLTTGLQGSFSCLSTHNFWGIFHPVSRGSHETKPQVSTMIAVHWHILCWFSFFSCLISHPLRTSRDHLPHNKPSAPILEYQSLKWRCFWNNQVEVSKGTWIWRLETQVETLGWKIFNI